MHARVTTVQIQPEKIDEANNIFRDSVILVWPGMLLLRPPPPPLTPPPFRERGTRPRARFWHAGLLFRGESLANNLITSGMIPAAQAQKGFRAAYLLVDSATGKGMSITAWDSLEDLQANESSGFYQEQLAKFAPLFTAPPTRETYEVSVQAQA